MAITDKTRKILWGRSGNRCAICKRELVIEATEQDDESVVGEECHIVSSRKEGPRHEANDAPDSYENLILLCRTHHKQVDDQTDTFTPDILQQIKVNHENWVREKLSDEVKTKPIRIRRKEGPSPVFLRRLSTGAEVLDLLAGAYGSSMDHDDLESPHEVDLVRKFLQSAWDWGEIHDVLEPGDRVDAAFNLSQSIQELKKAGFYVLGGREIRVLEGGNQPEPSDWPVAILVVKRGPTGEKSSG